MPSTVHADLPSDMTSCTTCQIIMTAINEITEKPQTVSVGIKTHVFQQLAEFLIASLNVTDRIRCHSSVHQVRH